MQDGSLWGDCPSSASSRHLLRQSRSPSLFHLFLDEPGLTDARPAANSHTISKIKRVGHGMHFMATLLCSFFFCRPICLLLTIRHSHDGHVLAACRSQQYFDTQLLGAAQAKLAQLASVAGQPQHRLGPCPTLTNLFLHTRLLQHLSSILA